MQNVVIFEELNTEKTQLLKTDVNDTIHEVKLSHDSLLVMAWTKTGPLDGLPQIIVWSTKNRRKVSQIAIDDQEIICVHFSNYSNLLLVVSTDGQKSTIAVWDFLDGRRDLLCKSIVPFKVIDARWNPYIKEQSDEFVTICEDSYHYWRITREL